MQISSQRIADLSKAIERHTASLAQARAEHQRIQDELRRARIRLAILEIEEERDPTFLQPQTK